MITVEKLEKGTYFDDAFKISFRYDPTTVAKVKELAERRYLPEDRAWEIPAHELPALIEKVGLSNIKSEEAVVQALNTKEIEDKREATQERLKGIKPVRDFDFKTAPLPHQIEAFNYGMEKNSLLIGDEQGLGKTKESNALMLYAIIYGFSQTTNTAFTGSVDYLCEWLGGVSRPTIINTLDNLVKQGLLTKSSTTKGALIYNSYTALRPSKKILSDEDPTSKKTLPDTSKNFLLNKDSKDNIEKSISKEMEGKAPKKRSYSTILEDPVNKFVKEALSKFIQYCRGKNYRGR